VRADAKKNYDRLLEVGRDVVAEQGAEASLRDVARRADVGLGTLYRHFPTREALLEALLRTNVDELTAQAADRETSITPEDALISWLRDSVALTHEYRGVAALLTAALEDTGSALNASCVALNGAGTRALERAHGAGLARADIDGTDLFALVAALAWLYDQPTLAQRADRLFAVISDAILTSRAVSGVSEKRRRGRR
jgi:AcrR family transcriptional regulator